MLVGHTQEAGARNLDCCATCIAMNLRTQVGIMLIAVFGCLVAASTFVQLRVIYPSFERLEASLAKTDADRCVQAINREVDHVVRFTIDWGVWNDMYQFAMDGNKTFYDTNLANRDYFRQINMPVMVVCDSTGKVVYQHTLDPVTYEPMELGLFPKDALPANHPLMRPTTEEEVSGVILTERGPLLVSSRVILHSDESGPPLGRFIAGRFIDDAAMAQLCEQTAVRFKVWATTDALPVDVAPHMTALRASPADPLVDDAGRSELHVYRIVRTMVEGQSLVLRADVPRSITAQGASTIRFGLLSLLFAAGCIVLGLIFMLQRRVVNPIVTLKDHAISVASSGDLTARLKLARRDEVGALAGEFDRMIEHLAETQSALARASRQAGMAEVASGVLHNVGNAMTNATVSVSQLQRGLEQSRAAGLVKAAAMIKDHEQDLATFLTQDSRGRQLPEYLLRLGESLSSEQRGLVDDARRLQASLDHINEIIRAQQGLAVAPEVVETTQISNVIAQAILLVKPSYERHKVTLKISIEDDFVVRVDRARLQQVLVNLLTNALQATKPVDGDRRAVEVFVGKESVDGYFIEVRDRGVGFESVDRHRLFAQGYTTRKGGHGVGLHFCANAVKQMGGSISAESAGPDQGATFRMVLPLPPLPAQEARLAA